MDTKNETAPGGESGAVVNDLQKKNVNHRSISAGGNQENCAEHFMAAAFEVSMLDFDTTLMKAAALIYAFHGFPVFPCDRITKKPLTKNGFKDATTDPKQITAWWTDNPDASIGVPTGPASGLFVIDIDVSDGKLGLESLAVLEAEVGPLKTKQQTTGSGGRHYIFRYPPDLDPPLGNTAGKLGPGIDTRGAGGYIIVPPSGHESGQHYQFVDPKTKIEPLPPAVITRLQKPKNNLPPPSAPPPSHFNGDGTPYGRKALEGICAEMANAPEGQRNDTLNRLALRLGALVAGGELAPHTLDHLKYAARQAGLDKDEIEKTAQSGYKTGLQSPARAPAKPNLRIVSSPPQGTGTDGPAAHDLASNPEARTDKPTQDQIALVVYERFGQIIRYNHTDNHWYVFTGHIWERDETGLVFNWIRRVVRDHNPEGSKDLGKSATTKGVETFCKCDERLALTSKFFNADDLVLGCNDGVLELETGTLRPGRPLDLITMRAGANPALTEDCPTWFWFLKHATKEDLEYISFLKRLSGYLLAGGNPEQIFIIIYGPGGTGKSLFLAMLRAMLGDYAQVGDLSLFMEKESNERGYATARLQWIRLVTGSETKPGQSLNTAFLKVITGEGTLPARPIYGHPFDLSIKFVPIMSSNYRPTLRNVDSGLTRRILICLFKHKPENPDIELEQKLKKELPGILRWATNGYLEYRRDGLKPPAVVQTSTKTYFESEDIFGQWLRKNYINEEGKSVGASDLLASWNFFREEQGLDPKKKHSAKMLANLLDSRGYQVKHKSQGNVYLGLRLRTPSDPPADEESEG